MDLARWETKKQRILVEFANFEASTEGSSRPEWVTKLRRRAIEQFGAHGFPTPQNEQWRYTNLSNFVEAHEFRFVKPAGQITIETLAPFLLAKEQVLRLVFVDGQFAPGLSQMQGLTAGITVSTLSEALATGRRGAQFFGQVAPVDGEAFTALNTAFAGDGVFVHLDRDKALDLPVHLLHVSTAQPETAACPRALIVLEAGSRLTFLETFVGLGQGTYCTNAVTEVVLERAASLDYYAVQREGEAAFHFSRVQVKQERDSRFHSHCIALGGALSRSHIGSQLVDENTECRLGGLFMASGEQHTDNYTTVEHLKPHTSSHELYKGILGGRATGVFNGRVIVSKDAQKTDAHQTNKNLLLSNDATINTKPQLEIFANDVKCTHGAAIGQIEEEALFYLRSRGIDEREARGILTYAFAADILGRIQLAPLRASLERWLFSRWRGGNEGAAMSREGA